MPMASVKGTAAEFATRMRLRGSMKFGLAIAIRIQRTIRTANGAKARQRLALPARLQNDCIAVFGSIFEMDFMVSELIVNRLHPA